MVLAEMISSGELDEVAEAVGRCRASAQPSPHRRRRWPRASRSAMPCCTSRASSSTSSPRTSGEKERLEAAIAEMRNHVDSLVDRSEFAREGNTRGAGGVPHVRLRPRLGAAHARGGGHRADRGSRGGARAERHPGAHAAAVRPLPARAAARSRRPRQPAAPHPHRRGRHRRPRPAAARRHHRGAQHGAGGAPRLRPGALRGLVVEGPPPTAMWRSWRARSACRRSARSTA
jgi:hypothetical protein